jgi:hypothetical protein
MGGVATIEGTVSLETARGSGATESEGISTAPGCAIVLRRGATGGGCLAPPSCAASLLTTRG